MPFEITSPIERILAWTEQVKAGHSAVWRNSIEGLGFLAAVLLSALVAFALSMTTPIRLAETLSEDLRSALTAPPTTTPMAIIKVDDTALAAMSESSACRCLSPIDKVWLARVISGLDRKGVRAIALDYLIDTWRTPQEIATFKSMAARLRAPLVAVVDPDMKPGIDFPVIPGVRYANARALVTDDYDNIVRRYDPFPDHRPSLAAEVVAAVGGAAPRRPFILNYRRPDPTTSAENAGALAPGFSAAFVDAVPDALLRGRIVFIGRTTRAAGATADTPKEDMHMTPLRFLAGNVVGTPGVEIHAHAVDQMLHGDRLRRLGGIWVAALVVAASALGALLGRETLSWWLSSLIGAVGVALAAAAALLAFAAQGVIVPITAPILGFTVGFFLLSRLEAVKLQSERRFYSSALERYLSPSVIDRIVNGSESLSLGAHERDLTILISDLESFSILVAETPPQDFAKVMNDYFGGLTEILWRHEALIDKMTGDGIIAIFGAPIAQPDHAERALACARDIDAFAERFRVQSQDAGLKVGRTRIGVNSGLGLVGNFGGDRRFNYTAYGQVVVIAARLEAANKETNTRILFSEATRAKISAFDDVRSVGDLKLKGVAPAVSAYTFG